MRPPSVLACDERRRGTLRLPVLGARKAATRYIDVRRAGSQELVARNLGRLWDISEGGGGEEGADGNGEGVEWSKGDLENHANVSNSRSKHESRESVSRPLRVVPSCTDVRERRSSTQVALKPREVLSLRRSAEISH